MNWLLTAIWRLSDDYRGEDSVTMAAAKHTTEARNELQTRVFYKLDYFLTAHPTFIPHRKKQPKVTDWKRQTLRDLTVTQVNNCKHPE